MNNASHANWGSGKAWYCGPQIDFNCIKPQWIYYKTILKILDPSFWHYASPPPLLTARLRNHTLKATTSYSFQQRMDKHTSFVFARQYRNCFSRRINALVPRNQPIKTAVGIVMYDFHGLKTIIFRRVADIAYFWLAVTEIFQFFHVM